MDKIEYEQKENKKLEEIKNNKKQSRNIEDKQEITRIKPTELFPEYKIKENGIYGLKSDYLNLNSYLLLFDQVIVKIYPYSTKQNFENYLGMSIDSFIELIKENKVLPLVAYPYPYFPDFFYETIFTKFQEIFPRTSRARKFLQVDNTYKKQLSAQLKTICKTNHFSELEWNSFVSDVYDLALVQANEMVNIIQDIAKIDLEFAVMIAKIYSNLLIKPLFENLGGINSYTSIDIYNAKRFLLKAKHHSKLFNKKNFINSIEKFLGINPEEFHKYTNKTKLSSKLELNTILHTENTTKFIEDMEKDNMIIELRNNIKKIYKKTYNNVTIKDIEKIFKEINKKIKKDAKRLQLLNTNITSIITFGNTLAEEYHSLGATGSIFSDKKISYDDLLELFSLFLSYNNNEYKPAIELFVENEILKHISSPLSYMYWKSTKK